MELVIRIGALVGLHALIHILRCDLVADGDFLRECHGEVHVHLEVLRQIQLKSELESQPQGIELDVAHLVGVLGVDGCLSGKKSHGPACANGHIIGGEKRHGDKNQSNDK